MTDPDTERCSCGRALHYLNPDTEAFITRQVAEHGPTVRLTTPRGTWAVPRHYIALHGISAQRVPELAALHNWRKLPL